ncbi:MAG: hypothetical protein U1A77_02185 [Pirellulales bacterium]
MPPLANPASGGFAFPSEYSPMSNVASPRQRPLVFASIVTASPAVLARRLSFTWGLIVAWGMLFSALAAPTQAASPTITNLSVRGLRIGGTTTLTIQGSDLGAGTRLLLPWPTATQTVVGEPTAQQLVYEVTVPADAHAGIEAIRVANAQGVSNAIPVGVDRLEQIPFTPQIKQLPVALHGTLAGDQRLQTSFTGKKGDSLAADVECQRLGGSVRPVLRLYDSRGAQLAWSGPRVDIAGDTRLFFTLPADGEYSLEVHDVLYRGAAPGFVRLKLGALHVASTVFPLGVTRGGKAALQWLGGNVPPDWKSEFSASAGFPGDRPAPSPSNSLYTGHAPRVAVSEFPEVLEQPGASSLGRPPLAISGRLAVRGEEDRLPIDVTPGGRLQVEVVARRVGSPIDGVLGILGPQGNGLAAGDDRPGTPDPAVDFTVPAGVNKLLLSFRDLQGRGGEDFVYRIVVRDLARPAAALSMDAERLNIPAGGSVLLPVQVTRQAYDGAVTLQLEGLPPGIDVQGASIAPQATQGLLSLSAAENAQPASAITHLLGRGGQGEVAWISAAQVAEGPTHRLRPWSRSELAVAIASPAPLTVAWSNESPADKLPLGWKLARQLIVKRTAPAVGAVRLKLVTTQPMPRKTIKKDNRDQQVDDVERALRFEGEPLIAAGQAEVAAQIIVPADLPAGPWSLAVVAELLAADNKTVVATANTPVRGLETRALLTLQMTSPATLAGKAGEGETGKVVGKVVRDAGWDTPVTVTLVGLPDGVVAPQVVVPPSQTEFSLPLNFAAGARPGELKGVRVVAMAPFDPAQPAGLVRSNELPITINLMAAGDQLPNERFRFRFRSQGVAQGSPRIDGGMTVSLWSMLATSFVALPLATLDGATLDGAANAGAELDLIAFAPKARAMPSPVVTPRRSSRYQYTLPPQGQRPDSTGTSVRRSTGYSTNRHGFVNQAFDIHRTQNPSSRSGTIIDWKPRTSEQPSIDVVKGGAPPAIIHRSSQVDRANYHSYRQSTRTIYSQFRAVQPRVHWIGEEPPGQSLVVKSLERGRYTTSEIRRTMGDGRHSLVHTFGSTNSN